MIDDARGPSVFPLYDAVCSTVCARRATAVVPRFIAGGRHGIRALSSDAELLMDPYSSMSIIIGRRFGEQDCLKREAPSRYVSLLLRSAEAKVWRAVHYNHVW